VKSPDLSDLFLSFLRLGITAFGGPAMVVYIRDLAVRRQGWLDESTFDDGVALCQSIPGATAMQTAAYVGLKSRGVWGALIAFIGFGLPAFFFMTALSSLYLRYHTLHAALALFSVLQVIVVALVANAALLLGRGLMKRPAQIGLALVSALLFAVGASPFLVILLGAALGALFLRVKRRGGSPQGAYHTPLDVRPILLVALFVAAGMYGAFAVSPRLFEVALAMFKIDCFAFGGGFGALPLMLHEVVAVKGWMTGPTFMDGIALGQVTPGPIMITATFVGYLTEGIRGAVVATGAVFAPSFLFLLITTPLFDRLKSSTYFVAATKGAFATFLGLLLFMTVKFAFLVPWDYTRVAIAMLAFAALLKKVDTFYIVVAGAVLSLLVFR
jgi:chromate transporter